MTGKEKIMAAFSKEGAAQIPAVICYEGIFYRDHRKHITDTPWWHNESPDIDQQREWHSQTITRIGQDWLSLPPYGLTEYSPEDRENIAVQETPEGVFKTDRHTGARTRIILPGDHGADVVYRVEERRIKQTPQSPEDLDRHIPAPPEDIAPDPARHRLALDVIGAFADLFKVSSVLSPFWSCASLFGYEELFMATVERPDLVAHACERYLDLAISQARRFAALGADGIWIEECFTDMIHPDTFRNLNVPYLGRLLDAIRSLGLKSIYYFTGNPAGKLDQILSVGADALAFEESKKNFRTDIDEIADAVQGRCAVLGNLDAVGVLQNGSEEALRAEIARQIRAGRRNNSRFVMSLGSPVTPSTPVDKVRLYCDLAHEIGER